MGRALRRAAVIGTTAHVANQRGQAAGAAAAQQAAPPAQAPPPPAETAPAAAPVDDMYEDLKKLKELLDSGALTQAEFDAQKAKLLG